MRGIGFHILFVLFLYWFQPATSYAQLVLKGEVVRIIDGDTYELLVNRQTYKIRMQGIDAPEKSMPYAEVSKNYLASLCFQKTVTMQQTSTDRNGRIVGKTYLASGAELGLAMVQAGMAWHFTRYSDDVQLSQAEITARRNRKGLWADPNPIAPWDWRKMRRKK